MPLRKWIAAGCRPTIPNPAADTTACRRRAPPAAAKERPALRPAPAEPAVAPFADLERQVLEVKSITIDGMVLYTATLQSAMCVNR